MLPSPFSLLLFFLILIQHSGYHLCGQVGVEIAVDIDDGCKSTSPDASDHFETEQSVPGRFPRFDFQFPLDCLEHCQRTFDVTSGSPANLNVKPTLRRKPELIVKRCHSIDFTHRYIQCFPHRFDCFSGKKALSLLNILKNRDERVS